MMGSKLARVVEQGEDVDLAEGVAGGSCTQTCATSLDPEQTGLLEPIARDVRVTTCASPTPHASMTAARVHAATNGGLPVPATITDAGPRRGATSFVVSAT